MVWKNTGTHFSSLAYLANDNRLNPENPSPDISYIDKKQNQDKNARNLCIL